MWPRVDGLRTLELGHAGEQRDRLNGYVLHGSKRATAGIADEYAEEGEALEHVGERLVLLDNDGAEVGRVEVTGVVVRRFEDVPFEFADAEGEGFASVDDWREGHRRYWEREGRSIGADTQIVCISFDLL
ncbi:MAG: hypothetical protein JWP11_1231 [Frankiales bacterium]|jgi:uncharacterized protein YhfF|nr:hypothetical protein [Frankiales bacterium]